MAATQELNDQNFKETLADKELAFVDFYASWCGPCRLFSPLFDKLSTTSPHAFFKIDGDKNPQSRSNITIDNLPYVAAFKKGQFIRGISTSTEAGLKDFIREMEAGQ